MLPWVYEFHWTAFHITFLLVFFTVAVLVASALMLVGRRSRLAMMTGKSDAIRWHSDFHDMPSVMKTCRHELTGEIRQRTCNNEFQCDTCTVHHAFLRLQGPAKEQKSGDDNVFGFSMPQDRYYHRGHAWVMNDSEGFCLAGLDDFGKRLAGTIESIELPPVGTKLHANGQGWNVRTMGTVLRILAPVSGEVVAHGSPEDPWLIKIKPDEPKTAAVHLLRGNEVRPWIMKEVERLQIALAGNGANVTLADGGEIIRDFHRHFPKADWDGILGQMFLEA